jgi:hypothetical protein
MNDPEGFLSRWARRKRDVAKSEEGVTEEKVSERPDASVPDASGNGPKQSAAPHPEDNNATQSKDKTEEPPFDITSLPSLESITGETDIRPFLAAGVPASLRQAALRRMWMIDPHVREIVDLAEYAWDFTAPGTTGFDLSPPTGDIKRMIADILGDKSESDSDALPEEAQASEPTAPEASPEQTASAHRNVTAIPENEESEKSDAPHQAQIRNESVRQTIVAQHDANDVALQKNDATQESEQESEMEIRRPTHGGALPK